jgi:hypothetical protein
MYLTLRMYRGARSPTEIGKRVTDGLIPVLQVIPGVSAYYAAVAVETRSVFGVTLFDDREHALIANERTRQWVVVNMHDLLPNPPDVTGGEVLHRSSAPEDALSPGGRITIITLDVFGSFEVSLPRVREAFGFHASPIQGIRQLYGLRSESHTNRGVFIILHDSFAATPDDMRRILEEQAQDTLSQPPTVSTGQVIAAAIS